MSSPKIDSGKPVRSLIPDRFFETIFIQDYQNMVIIYQLNFNMIDALSSSAASYILYVFINLVDSYKNMIITSNF